MVIYSIRSYLSSFGQDHFKLKDDLRLKSLACVDFKYGSMKYRLELPV